MGDNTVYIKNKSTVVGYKKDELNLNDDEKFEFYSFHFISFKHLIKFLFSGGGATSSTAIGLYP